MSHFIHTIIVPTERVAEGNDEYACVCLSVCLSLVSGHYLEKQLLNLIQTWYVHFLGETSESICFWITVAQCWLPGGENSKWLIIHLFDQSLEMIRL